MAFYTKDSNAIFTAQVMTGIYLQLLCDSVYLVVTEHFLRYVGVAGSGGAPFVYLVVWQQLGRADLSVARLPSFSVVGGPEADLDCWSVPKTWLWPRAFSTVRVTGKLILVLCLNHLCVHE